MWLRKLCRPIASVPPRPVVLSLSDLWLHCHAVSIPIYESPRANRRDDAGKGRVPRQVLGKDLGGCERCVQRSAIHCTFRCALRSLSSSKAYKTSCRTDRFHLQPNTSRAWLSPDGRTGIGSSSTCWSSSPRTQVTPVIAYLSMSSLPYSATIPIIFPCSSGYTRASGTSTTSRSVCVRTGQPGGGGRWPSLASKLQSGCRWEERPQHRAGQLQSGTLPSVARLLALLLLLLPHSMTAVRDRAGSTTLQRRIAMPRLPRTVVLVLRVDKSCSLVKRAGTIQTLRAPARARAPARQATVEQGRLRLHP